MNYFLIYIIGVFVAYFIVKYIEKSKIGLLWTKKRRLNIMFFSILLSWVFIIPCFIDFLMSTQDDKPASW